ncbi:MgtC/SapB family protein [Yinghuangia soli]|uniref:MgtC/SapB family protein n=1 Tax=Yinghuangia soli TaxID=2908204 RepID=A0AA41U375_9ACTN|nr:MgtC/SapB family protein [Yinghuangia soli]MCF2527804.1 MgtC/SapB family protein [Yinghuangia soli]
MLLWVSDAAPPLFGTGDGSGQSLRQFAELGIALVLSTLIGLEREARQKSAGLRTHMLVGVGSALFMEVSIHGFGAAVGIPGVSLDPSRVAAQIVSGIGFIGGGLIFVKRDIVRGLTTAATIWFVCAVGMACGGGLVVLAAGAVVIYFAIVRGTRRLTARMAPDNSYGEVEVRLLYAPHGGVLRSALEVCTRQGFQVTDVRTEGDAGDWLGEVGGAGYRKAPAPRSPEDAGTAVTSVLLRLEGAGSAHPLLEELTELEGVRGVSLGVRAATTE